MTTDKSEHDTKHEHEGVQIPETRVPLPGVPVPLPVDDCPKRSAGGSCLCVPPCARCHIGLHMSVHSVMYAWMSGAAPYDHEFQLEEGATKPVPKPAPKVVPEPKHEPAPEPTRGHQKDA